MKRIDDPAQLTFGIFIPPIVRKNGDGSFTVTPGRPIKELSSEQLSSHFAVSVSTVYRWREEGIIDDKFVRRAGRRKFRFSADLISHLEAEFRKGHE